MCIREKSNELIERKKRKQLVAHFQVYRITLQPAACASEDGAAGAARPAEFLSFSGDF